MLRILCVSLLLSLFIAPAQARDSKMKFSIKAALQTEDAKSQLDPTIKLFFGEQKHPKEQQRFAEVQSNKKTNAFNKSDEGACQWVFLAAMTALQNRARNEGGNAVVNIRSYYKKHLVSSTSEFECGVGKFVAGVTFKGVIVKLPK